MKINDLKSKSVRITSYNVCYTKLLRVGIFSILLFYRKYFNKAELKKDVSTPVEETAQD